MITVYNWTIFAFSLPPPYPTALRARLGDVDWISWLIHQRGCCANGGRLLLIKSVIIIEDKRNMSQSGWLQSIDVSLSCMHELKATHTQHIAKAKIMSVVEPRGRQGGDAVPSLWKIVVKNMVAENHCLYLMCLNLPLKFLDLLLNIALNVIRNLTIWRKCAKGRETQAVLFLVTRESAAVFALWRCMSPIYTSGTTPGTTNWPC